MNGSISLNTQCIARRFPSILTSTLVLLKLSVFTWQQALPSPNNNTESIQLWLIPTSSASLLHIFDNIYSIHSARNFVKKNHQNSERLETNKKNFHKKTMSSGYIFLFHKQELNIFHFHSSNTCSIFLSGALKHVGSITWNKHMVLPPSASG